ATDAPSARAGHRPGGGAALRVPERQRPAPVAEGGTRSAERTCGGGWRATRPLMFRVPRSAFRVWFFTTPPVLSPPPARRTAAFRFPRPDTSRAPCRRAAACLPAAPARDRARWPGGDRPHGGEAWLP